MNTATAYGRIAQLAALPEVHRAFGWMHLQEKRFRQWQRALVEIPAPPFGEEARAAWALERMRELGLVATEMDTEGNAIGYLREPVPGAPLVLLSAHIDTVFPAGTPIEIEEEDAMMRAPGACDNAAGVTAMLAMLGALQHAQLVPACNVLVAANVGEEAEGDLRGIRHLFLPRHGRRIVCALAMEGSGTETVVTRGLGSRRFRVTVSGNGGHAWTDAESPNPAVVLARAIAELDRFPLPQHPRTILHLGQIEGGASVTSIPERVTALFDLRSSDATELLRCEVALFRAVEDAVIAANRGRDEGDLIRFSIEGIGDRPAAELHDSSNLLATVRAVDRHLGLKTGERLGSTDANLPLSLGVEAVALGGGGTSGGIHTSHEWFDATGREMALRRVLLILLDCCTRAAETTL